MLSTYNILLAVVHISKSSLLCPKTMMAPLAFISSLKHEKCNRQPSHVAYSHFVYTFLTNKLYLLFVAGTKSTSGPSAIKVG